MRKIDGLSVAKEFQEKVEKIWSTKATVVSVVSGGVEAVTIKLGEWLQQILGKQSNICPEECRPGNGSDATQNPQAPRPLVEDPGFKWQSPTSVYGWLRGLQA